MRVINPYVEVWPFDPADIMHRLELAGRVCHKSEERIGEGTAKRFLSGLISRGHESVLEHCSITVKFACDRGVTHELVRHRLGAYSQESTRYCNYGSSMTFIRPFFFPNGSSEYYTWYMHCLYSERRYQIFIQEGRTLQEARSVLPNSLKTEIVTTYNIRQWRHVLHQRCSIVDHPQMRQVMIPLLMYFQHRLPLLFGDVEYDIGFPQEQYAAITFLSL